jgi:hypothetical protein
MKSKWIRPALGALLSVCIGLSAAAADIPSLASPDLARGPFSSMRMLLEKTFLNIDVATIEARVSERVQAQLSTVANGRQYAEALEGELAKAALGADHIVIQITFLRDASSGQWLDAVRESLEKASRSGLISAEIRRRVSDELPQRFKAIEADGFHKGDRVLYEVRPAQLRTVAVTAGGKVLFDRVDNGETMPRVVLSSYFAPGSDYRTLLLKSLFAPAAAPR